MGEFSFPGTVCNSTFELDGHCNVAFSRTVTTELGTVRYKLSFYYTRYTISSLRGALSTQGQGAPANPLVFD